MARGIDGIAHRAALEAGGRTVAVLGTGVDVAYPPSHRALHAEIARRGLLLSELQPGAHSHAGSFPNRNRIIAALASVVIVVEAGQRSGAKITADYAIDLGRTLAAVPGPIDMPQSAGTNELLRDGAHVIASIPDALALAGLTLPVRGGTEPDDPLERTVWEALRRGPMDLDALCNAASLPAHTCLATVSALELRGVLECELTGHIRLR
jgi:DNA processing protein